MVAQIGMSREIRSRCTQVAFGHCLCGRAAEDREVIFASHVDSCHETHFPGMPDHGHYCVPIQADDRLLGVLVLYLQAGHERGRGEELFLRSVADVIANLLQRRRGEQALALAHAVEQAQEGIAIVGEDGRIDYVNPAFSRMTGLDGSEDRRTNVTVERLLANAGARQPGQVSSGGDKAWAGRIQLPRSGMGALHTDVTITPVRDPDHAVVSHVAVVRDTTHEVELQQQLHQAQKMEAVGRLAGGIAHDFNNLLAVILSYAEFIKDALLPDDPIYADAEEVEAAGRRAAVLTRKLLTFSRSEVTEAEVFDAQVLIEELKKMLGRLIGEDIELRCIASEDMPELLADPGLVEQVVINMAVNARDAMPNGGRLTVVTKAVTLQAEVARKLGLEPGQFGMIEISDTGSGMPPEVLAHIFEPFFTTKEAGKGTGLGLATAYGVISQAGGAITVDSELGRGTRFQIYLPLADDAARAEATASGAVPADTGRASVPVGPATVLLVEDDDAVRRLARRTLEQRGYNVLTAAHPGEALILAEQNGPIHLLLTDVIMPGLDGPQLVERLGGAVDAVLFMSGYAGEALERCELDQPLLRKPFTPAQLISTVQSTLRKDPGPPKRRRRSLPVIYT